MLHDRMGQDRFLQFLEVEHAVKGAPQNDRLPSRVHVPEQPRPYPLRDGLGQDEMPGSPTVDPDFRSWEKIVSGEVRK